ncbi:MAG: hypothetical protein B6I24_06925 [Bacteroidetes bacterium 4572_128]|nr:MAG: hypothetical protein B6I24_06925 [Bacteroidetes bacterium 4572_128]
MYKKIVKMVKKNFFIIFIIFISNSCTITYSTSGASISPDIKTVKIDYFKNQAQLINASLSQDFTEKLKEKFINETDLRVIDENGDLNFEGMIIEYSTTPMASGRDEISSLNKLKITIKVTYTNEKDDTYNYDKSFSETGEYESSRSLEDVEDEIVPEILNKIIDKIFNESVANW